MKRILMATLMVVLGVGTASADFLYESEMIASGYKGTETLSGFPVLVRLAKDSPKGFQYGLCQADGKDIAFYSSDGETVYPHEIEKWDASGESLVWVRIPSLAGMDTKFLFRFGDASVTTAPVAKTTWADSNGGFYAGVWHFNEMITAEDATAKEAPASADSALYDVSVDMSAKPASTAWNRDFTRMTSTNAVVGFGRVIDTQFFSHGEGHRFACGDCSSFNMGNSFSISLWTCPYVAPASTYCNAVLGNGTTSETGNWRFGWYGFNKDFCALYTGSTQAWLPSSGTYVATWRHVVLVLDGANIQLYVDGVRTATKANLSEIGFTEGLVFSLGGVSGERNYCGALDEARLLSKPVSADWVKAEYDTAKNVSFVVAGDVKSRATDMLTVTSNTEELGTVTPAYGVRTDIKGGDVVNFSAPDEVTVLSDVLKCRYDGWKLYRKNGEDVYELIDSAATNAFRYVHEAGTDVRFVWNVRRIVPISVSAEGGTVTVNGQTASTVWCDEGEATLVATPDADHAFAYWSGDVSDNTEVTARETTLDGAQARSITCVFRQGRGCYRCEAPLTVSGYTLGETALTNFPVLVRISPGRIRKFSYADASADGSGIAFFSPDGKTAYAHEVDQWDVTGESTVWVKVPRLSGTTTKVLFNYGAKQGDVTPTKYVWNDGMKIRYAGVWHMNEAIDAESAATTKSADSVQWSALNLDAAANNAVQTSSNGVIGLSRRISDGTTTAKGLSVPSFDALGFGGDYAVSGWFCYDYGVWGRDGFLTRSSLGFYKWYNETCEYFTLNNDSGKMFSASSFSNCWNLVTLVCSNGTMSAYINGQFKKVADSDIQSVEGHPFVFGYTFHGRVDECRLGAVPVSQDWMRTEYETVANADFVTFGKVKNRWLGFSVIVR